MTVSGIGRILALTIMLETGDIKRFKSVGNYVSYCRCVRSVRLSNRKQKGKGNAKNGNKYLSWAFVEAAIFAIRWDARFIEMIDKTVCRNGSTSCRDTKGHGGQGHLGRVRLGREPRWVWSGPCGRNHTFCQGVVATRHR